MATSIADGVTCYPKCAAGYTTSVDSPTSLTCENAKFSPGANYKCLATEISGTLTVKSLKATGLKKKDTWDDSDPFVELALGYTNPQTQKTATVKDNNYPHWQGTWKFDITNRYDNLILRVRDNDDYSFDDSLGEVWLNLKEVIEKGGPTTYTKGLEGNGKLFVEVAFQAS